MSFGQLPRKVRAVDAYCDRFDAGLLELIEL
jgi:hypothetical protein